VRLLLGLAIGLDLRMLPRELGDVVGGAGLDALRAAGKLVGRGEVEIVAAVGEWVDLLSAFSRTPLSISAFSISCPKFDLPSMSLRTFIRSFESEAERWLTCVMPLAVLVKTVFRSMAPRLFFSTSFERQ
jgi:hypothetical protein